MFMPFSNCLEGARTVAVLLDRHTGPLQQRQQQVGKWLLVVELQVLIAFDGTGAVPQHDRRERKVIMIIAVRHVRAVQEDRVVEDAVLAVRLLGELAEEVRDHLAVPGLQLRQLHEAGRIIVMVRQRMERVGNTDMRISLVADLGRHHERHDSRHIRLVRQCDHVKQESDLLVEVRNADRYFR